MSTVMLWPPFLAEFQIPAELWKKYRDDDELSR